MKSLIRNIFLASLICCLAPVSLAVAADADEGESAWPVRHHGFDRSAKRKSTTFEVPSRVERSAGTRSPKKDDFIYGYPERSAEKTEAPAQEDLRLKFGPPPRKYDAVAEPEQTVEVKDDKPVVNRSSDKNSKKRSTVIVLPPKKEKAASKKRSVYPAVKKEESYGYNPAPNQVENGDRRIPQEPGPTVSYERGGKKRSSTTITLPPKNTESSAGKNRSKIRDKRILGDGKNYEAQGPQPPQAEVQGAAAGVGQPVAPKDPQKSRHDRRNALQLKEEAPNAAALPPVPPTAASNINTPEDMERAYKAFDHAYENSLGKSRKELTALWGFPLQRMGDNGDEAVYGFRQRGVLAENPETGSNKKQTSHYTSGNLRPGQKGKNFGCLVILWIDKGGRGVVVDGDAVGDCFMVEALRGKPLAFER